MKKTAVFLLLLAIFFVAFLNPFKIQAFDGLQNLLYYAPCQNPIPYRIGSIDQRFDVSEQQFQEDTETAAEKWDHVLGRTLFVYDPHAKLSVNLVYDKRQDLSNQIYSLKDQLETDKNSIKPEVDEYESRSRAFRQRMADLNSQIEYWNSKGGAPEDEYNKLIQEQQSLQQEADALNTMARQLNQSSDEFSAKVGQLNQTVQKFNSALTVRPEEGLYDPNTNTISIYFHTDETEFVHTLAHELGHALGMGHVANPNAIMYTQTNDQVTPTQDDIAELTRACTKKSYAEIFMTRLQYVYDFYTHRNTAAATNQ